MPDSWTDIAVRDADSAGWARQSDAMKMIIAEGLGTLEPHVVQFVKEHVFPRYCNAEIRYTGKPISWDDMIAHAIETA